MKKIFFAAAFILSGFLACAQDYAADIKQILVDFSELKSYIIRARVVIRGEEDYSFDAWVKSGEHGNHTRTDLSEMLVNDKVAVAIDHEDKAIRVQYGDYKEKSVGKDQGMNLEMVDELLGESVRVEFLGTADQYKTYVLYQDGGIEKTIIKINTVTGFFHEIEVFYKKDMSDVSSYKIQYTEFNKDPRLTKGDFDESKIIKQAEGGSYVAIGQYAEYAIEIINP